MTHRETPSIEESDHLRRFPLITLSGKPFEIGQQHGKRLRTEIHYAITTMKELLPVPLDQAMAYAAKSIPYSRKKAPELMEEIQGIAAGAGFSFEEIFTLNASLDLLLSRRQLRPTVGPDCWGMALTGKATADRKTFVTWTAEDNAKWFDACVLLKITPEKGLPCLVWTFAGFVGRPGANPCLALSATAQFRDDCGCGLPYPLVCRKALACKTTAEAVQVIAGYDRMAGMDYVIGDQKGDVVVLETSARASGWKPARPGWAAFAGRWSETRIPRLEVLLRQNWGANPLDSLKGVLRDHGPGNLCPHDGGLASLMTFIADVNDRIMWVAYGNACENDYERYPL